jgi:hypothetical protein
MVGTACQFFSRSPFAVWERDENVGCALRTILCCITSTQSPEDEKMDLKLNLSRMAVAAAALLLLIFAGGCASSSLTQPASTGYMQSAVGTPNELSPLAPPAARNVRKVGNNWLCEVNGRTMVYDSAAACWQPQQK